MQSKESDIWNFTPEANGRYGDKALAELDRLTTEQKERDTKIAWRSF